MNKKTICNVGSADYTEEKQENHVHFHIKRYLFTLLFYFFHFILNKCTSKKRTQQIKG